MCSCMNVRKLLFGSKNTTTQDENQLEVAVTDKINYKVAPNNENEIFLTTKAATQRHEFNDNKKYDEQGFKCQDKVINDNYDDDDDDDGGADDDNDHDVYYDDKRQKPMEKRSTVNEPQQKEETKITEEIVVASMKNIHNNNNNTNKDDYIGEYKSFVEEKPLMTASTPYSAMVDGFDFEKWFNNNNNHTPNLLMLSNKRKRHSSGGEESEYTIKAAAENDDTVAPLLSDQRLSRPLTLPKGGFTLVEPTDGPSHNQSQFQREEELEKPVLLVHRSSSSSSCSSNRVMLTQRHSRSHGRLNHHQLMRHALENSFMLQQTQSNLEYVVDEDDNINIINNITEEVVQLRRKNHTENARSTSLYERRQPKGPKLKLRLKSSFSCGNLEKINFNMDNEVGSKFQWQN